MKRRWKKRSRVQAWPSGGYLCNECEEHFLGLGVGRKFCNLKCKRSFLIKYDGDYLRTQMKKRDFAICDECELDVEKFHREQRRKIKRSRGEERQEIIDELASKGWPRDFNRTWWEAAHIHDRAFGGSGELSNFKTLCVPCHKAETKILLQRLAREKPLILNEREFKLLSDLEEDRLQTLQQLGGHRKTYHSDAMKKLVKNKVAGEQIIRGHKKRYWRTEKGSRYVEENESRGATNTDHEAPGETDRR